MEKNVIFKGCIDVICGPMFAGKTEELLRILNRLEYAKIPFLTFKNKIDTRTIETLKSRNGKEIKTIQVESSIDILNHLKNNSNINVIAIDEVQFFDEDIIDIIRILANKGFYIILSGLDKDFRGEPFEIMKAILCIADRVIKLTAICIKCGNLATYTQRLINSKPATYKDPIILIGDQESYEARCYQHFEYQKEKESNVEKLVNEILELENEK